MEPINANCRTELVDVNNRGNLWGTTPYVSPEIRTVIPN